MPHNLCGQLLSLFSVWPASHFHLFTTQRFEHTVHVLLLTYIPSSLTPVTTSHIHSNWAHFKSLKSSSSSINGFGDGSRSIQGHGKAQLYIACSPLIVYEFFCFKIKTKSRVDLYMPCKAIAHSTKLLSMRIPSTCEMYQGGIVGVCPLFQWV